MREVILLLSSLDRRGITLEARPGDLDRPGTILARPAAILTRADKEGITRHKAAILLLALRDPHDARVALDPPAFTEGPVEEREYYRFTLAGITLLVTPREWAQFGEEWWDAPPVATLTTTSTPQPPPRQPSLFGVTA